ncbi:MAG: histidinol-phosphatase [Lachnospiraceae bacterium]|nr:histidinol-phosphatase [Lachnospiraceae bacterium]
MKNYHTHTKLCKHAQGMPEDYCRVALQRGFTDVGFTDHTPLPDDLKAHIRMEREELPLYIGSVLKARKMYPQLRIFLGLECDYMPKYEWYYKDFILERMHMDYLIGSVHYYDFRGELMWFDGRPMHPLQYKIYADLYIKAMESGLFKFMAHPDLYCTNVYDWNKDAEECAKAILEAAQAMHIPLEVNTSGMTKAKAQNTTRLPYPREEFWAIASDYDINVVMNSDAHKPECIDDFFTEGKELILRHGLREVPELFPRF